MRFALFTLLCALLMIAPVMAQDDDPTGTPDESPLVALLRLVPNNNSAQSGFVQFVDLAATLTTLEDDAEWTDTNAWREATDGDLSYTTRWASLPDDLTAVNPFMIDALPSHLGFDFFTATQVIDFGLQPQSGTIWRGDFDVTAIIDAHEERGFSVDSVRGIPALCVDRCDVTPEIDFNMMDQNNLFDAGLGRTLPFLIVEDDLTTLHVPKDADLMPDLADTISGSFRSLWDNPEYRTLAEALTDPAYYAEATLIQARFAPVRGSVRLEYDFRSADAVRELPQQLRPLREGQTVPDWTQGYRSFPEYNPLVVFADMQTADEQIAVVALLYNFDGNAEFAAVAIRERIESFSNYARTNFMTPVVEIIGGTAEDHFYFSDETGLSVAVITVRYPLEADPATFYRTIITALDEGVFYPLWDITIP